MTSDLVKRLKGDLPPTVGQILRERREAADRIEALERERQWRPIEERPAPGTHYFGLWGNHISQCYETKNKPRLWVLFDGTTTAGWPDAWMPLPTPPSKP